MAPKLRPGFSFSGNEYGWGGAVWLHLSDELAIQDRAHRSTSWTYEDTGERIQSGLRMWRRYRRAD